VNTDAKLLSEAYKIVREQGPVVAGFQGMQQGVQPYVAGAMAGAKQLGQNVANAVTGSGTAPQNPMAAGQKAFTQTQMQQAIDGVIKAFNLPPQWKAMVTYKLKLLADEIMQQDKTATQRMNTYQATQQARQPVQPAQIPAPRV